jgi:hypothetical protein
MTHDFVNGLVKASARERAEKTKARSRSRVFRDFKEAGPVR